MSIVLVDASSDSLTISWPEAPDAKKSYLLEFKTDQDGEWQVLSEQLTTPQVRKRNLQSSLRYQFRVSSDGGTTWTTHEDLFALLSPHDDDQRIKSPPRVSLGGTLNSLKIEWDKTPSDTSSSTTSYEIHMRENKPGTPWSTIANDFPHHEVRKKNLTSNRGYQFRVRPTNHSVAFSPPSDPVIALGLSTNLQRIFQTLERGTLLRGTHTPVHLEEALGGKEFILLYASAHWCGPCRQFTPKLVNWYNTIGEKSSTVEVVFLSADHDASSFQKYYASMPWLAVDYDDDTREKLMAWIRVTGIPRLAVMNARTGTIIEDNAVGKSLDVNRWRQLAAANKK